MKISKENYNLLKENISNLVDKNGLEKVQKYYKETQKSPVVKDAKTRTAWDLMRYSGCQKYLDDIYKQDDINDTHLDTALKNICKELNIF